MIKNSSKEIILVIATGWGPKNGGINAFNKEFCIGLGTFLKANDINNTEVVCVVRKTTADEVNEAKCYGVTLVPFDEDNKDGFVVAENEALKIKNKLKGHNNALGRVKYVIVHDLATGDLIKEREIFPSNPSWVAIHHMHYEEYEYLKGYDRNIGQIEKIINQLELFNAADYVFAVGPLLKELLERYLRRKKCKKTVIELIPGLHLRDTAIDHNEAISAITFGRFDSDHDKVKLASLVIKAWTRTMESVDLKIPANLNVLGFDFTNETDRKRCKELYEKFSKTVSPYPYTDQSKLVDYILEDSTVAFMLSRHEGFGLTGWEAIGAGIPLIVSKNSGLWKCLENYDSGKYINNVFGIDLKEDFTTTKADPFSDSEMDQVIDGIKLYIRNRNEWHKQANDLKGKLEKVYTWENTAKTFLETIGVSTQNEVVSGEASYESEAEDIKKWNLSEFAEQCVDNTHALIISHRTKIIQPVNPADPYSGMLQFLDKFTNQDNEILPSSSGIKRTLLIFVLDFGYKDDGSIDEKALANYLALQSFIKAILLNYKEGSLGSHAATPYEIFGKHHPGKIIPEKLQEFCAHKCLIEELKSRVVIIVKNYESYIKSISNLEVKLSEAIDDNKNELMPNMIYNGFQGGIQEESDQLLFNNIYKHLAPNYILKQNIPPLDYLPEKLSTLITESSTNIDKSDSNAFGLYATVKFDDFNNADGMHVNTFVFNKIDGDCYSMPLDKRKKVKGKMVLNEGGVKDSMAVTCLAACHFKHEADWGKARTPWEIWPDHEKRSNIFRLAYQKLRAYGFTFFTLQQYLAMPVMFLKDLSFIKNMDLKEK